MNNQPVNQTERDDALFESMAADRKKRRRRIIRTSIIAVVILAVVGAIAVPMMRRNVARKYATSRTEVKSYAATIGTVSTTVSGTGVISDVDTEKVTVPSGIEIDEVKVSAGDTVEEGDILATVKTPSILSAISAAQKELDDLDDKITAAEHDYVNMYISTGVAGRVKRLIAEPGDTVIDCMTKNGAIAVMSIDGYMAVDIETDMLEADEYVTLKTDGHSYKACVASVSKGIAKILVTDNGPKYDAEAEIIKSSGESVGTSRLYINSPLSLTGYAGTISRLCTEENAFLYAGSAVYVLKDNNTTAAYDSLIQSRRDKEEEMKDLMKIMGDNAICAPYAGTISSVDYVESDSKSSTPTVSMMSSSSAASSGSKTKLVTMSPNKQVSVTIPVDESNILSLKVGQQADITVSSMNDETFTGEVTEINKVADSAAGVTQYSAVITFDKTPKMLQGMSATADISIDGVENAVIIPVDALHQTSTTHFVYTEYDAETKEYGGRRDVVSGVSNSNYVEIISGLEEGETVYYVEKQNNNFMFMMGGGNRSTTRR